MEIEIEQSDAEYVDLLVESNILFVTELQRLYPNMAQEEMAIILKEEQKHLKKVLERKKESQPMFGRGM